MNKSKHSILTAITSIFIMILNGLFSIVITKLVIIKYGSDFNGINTTANQFINMLLLIEGGFTIAANVALFKPMAANDYNTINGILSATRKIFNKIGFCFIIIGTILSFIYSFVIINSNLSPIISFLVFSMTIISTAFNLSYATKYRILLQSENKEYILNIIQIITLVLSQILILLFLYTNSNMLFIRFATMVGSIANSTIIVFITKKEYKYINFNVNPDYVIINGTKYIFIQKLTNVLYSTLPILFVSGTSGTIYASIYGIYYSILNFLKSIIYSFVNAPRMGFGRLIAENKKEYVNKVFLQYEFIVIYVTCILISTAGVLILPFIEIYTIDITDANYYNAYIAIIIILTTFFEIIHIPSGNIINMSGLFKIGMKMQTGASIILILLMIIGNTFLGYYGILLAVLITAIFLSIFEIGYIHCIYFNNAIFDFIGILLPNFIFSIILVIFELKYLPLIKSYKDFIFVGFILVIINVIMLTFINAIINKKYIINLIERIKPIIIVNKK